MKVVFGGGANKELLQVRLYYLSTIVGGALQESKFEISLSRETFKGY